MLILGLVDIPWWVLLLSAIVGYLWYTSRDFNFFKNQGIPGPTPYPLLGTALGFLRGIPPEYELYLLKNYGAKGCLGEFLGAMPSLTVYDEEMLSEIMVKEFSAFTNRMGFKSGSPINDNMLVTLEDAHWKHVRNEMTPSFTTGKLKKMNSEINRCAKTLADSLLEQAKTGGEVEMKEYTGGYTMDVIASTAFGIRVDSQKDRNNAFVEHARRAFVINTANPVVFIMLFFPALAKLLKWLGVSLNFFPKDIRDFFENITRQAIEMRKVENDPTRSDFLQLMIKAQTGENIQDDDEGEGSQKEEKSSGTGITTDEILANAMLFFVAGYDTTSTSLSFFMYNMACHPDVQDKLVDEINTVIGDKENIDTIIVQAMPYLDQCVNENLRLFPPAMRVNRRVKQDATVKGVFLKKDMVINIPIYGIHHDEKKWPNPEKFDPDRFSPENKKNRSPYHFIPFGNGPRNCIGMRLALQELKVAVIQVLRKIKVSPCEKTMIPIKFINNGALIKTDGGIHIKLEPRN